MQAFAGARQGGSHVDLVQHDMGTDAGGFGGDQGARDQVVGETRFGRHHDEQLRNVGGQQLRLVLVRAVQQRCPVTDRFDHALVLGGHLQVDAVTDRDIAFLAARDALQPDPVGERQVMAAMGSDDSGGDGCARVTAACAGSGSGRAQGRQFCHAAGQENDCWKMAFTLAAQMKSLIDSPPLPPSTLWVSKRTTHRL